MNVLLANITGEQRYKDAVVDHVDGWAWPDGAFFLCLCTCLRVTEQ